MKDARIEIERLYVRATGVRPELIEAAMAGLGGELRRRLARAAVSPRDSARAELRVEPIHLRGCSDAQVLRRAFADRLVEAIRADESGAGVS